MSPGSPHFKAKAVMVFPNTKAKAVVSFLFDDETYSLWPMKIQSIKCEVDVTYGPVEFVQIL
jgi:kinetochore protein Spc7/SPC105